MAASSAVSTDSGHFTQTRIHNRQLLALLRVLWTLYAVYVIVVGNILYLPSTLHFTLCDTAVCADGGTPRAIVEKLTQEGIDYRGYAVYKAVLNLTSAAISLLVAGALFWKRSDDSMALLTGAMLLSQSITVGVPLVP